MKQIPNNAVKEGGLNYRIQGRREIRTLRKEENRTSQINHCGGINVQLRKDSRTIHQVIHKRNQTWFIQSLMC